MTKQQRLQRLELIALCAERRAGADPDTGIDADETLEIVTNVKRSAQGEAARVVANRRGLQGGP